jgi:transposase
LPREEVIHDLPSDQKACGKCGSFLSHIGVEEREQLETISVRFIVKKHKRLKYACRCCGETIILAKGPFEAIEKGMAGPNLLAQVLVDKYADHLPLYRQEQRFKRHGLHISRSTLWNWVRLSASSLIPLVEAMKQDLLVVGHVFSDDTTMPTLREPSLENKGKQAKNNTMWVYTGPSKEKKKFPIVIYDFAESRGSEHPIAFLKDFKGYLQADAYSSYNPLFESQEGLLPQCIEVGCWAHVRRKFVEALTANPKSIAKEVLEMIGELYKVEKEFREKDLTSKEIAVKRQELSKPQLEKIHDWLLKYEPQVAPKSKLGQAISYTLSNWKALIVYIQEGRLEIDNNRSERCIKGVVLGRKNYMFMGSSQGGRAAATIYSLVETCKQNDVDPLAYLADVLARIPTHPNKQIHELLPYHWKPPQLLRETKDQDEKVA